MLKLDIDRENKRVLVGLSEVDDRTRRGIRQFWFAMGKTLSKEFKKEVMRKPRAGRTYIIRRGKTRRRHRASVAGETAANLTGNYRKNIGYQIRGTSEMVFGNDAEYATFLENGTKKMDARPGLGNAVSATEGENLSSAARLIERELLR